MSSHLNRVSVFALCALLSGLPCSGADGPGFRRLITQPDSYDYRLKFSVQFDGKQPACTLVSGTKIPEAPGEEKSAEFKVEDELNKAYQALRAKLNDAGRAVLKEKQLQWLKERDAISDEAERAIFTRLRTAYLQGRAEN